METLPCARVDDRNSKVAAATPSLDRRARRKIQALLEDARAPDEELEASIDKLARLSNWLVGKDADARLSFFVSLLEKDPALAGSLGERLRAVLQGGRSTRLFASAGLPARMGLLAEGGRRALGRVLPEPPYDGDLVGVVERLFPKEKHGATLERFDPSTLGRALELLGHPLASLHAGLSESLFILSARVASLGLADDVVDRCPDAPLAASPFLELPRACEALVLSLDGDPAAAHAACLQAIGNCREALAEVKKRLEAGAVSLDLVYRLELAEGGLKRIERIAETAAFRRPEAGAALAGALVAGVARERSVRSLANKYTSLLAKKVVEHSGETGDHYVTTSRREFRRMFLSAGGGGVLTAATTLFKFWIGQAKLPILFAGLASGVNYAGSFVAMQFAGFTLATKQPSATAATLARAVGRHRRDEEDTALGDVVAKITRSQLAAALGNVGLVIPTALLAAFAFDAWGRSLPLDAESARQVVASLHPLKSPTLPFAALTGVLLWLSSVFAGAAQNWANYRSLPEALGATRVARRTLGKRGAAWLKSFVARHVAGWGGNISLGVLLAAVPTLGAISGVGLDVRHVTLSAGALTFAASTLGAEVLRSPDLLWASVGIVSIASLNFGVSFALALWVAARSVGVTRDGRRGLAQAIVRKLRSAPLDFVRPPPEKAETKDVEPILELES